MVKSRTLIFLFIATSLIWFGCSSKVALIPNPETANKILHESVSDSARIESRTGDVQWGRYIMFSADSFHWRSSDRIKRSISSEEVTSITVSTHDAPSGVIIYGAVFGAAVGALLFIPAGVQNPVAGVVEAGLLGILIGGIFYLTGTPWLNQIQYSW